MLRTYSLHSALYQVWYRGTRIGKPDSRYRPDASTNIPYDWELELLAREIILNSQGGIVPRQNDHAQFPIDRGISHVRRIAEAISEVSVKSPDDALRAAHALIHQQIPWQDDDLLSRMARYARIMQFDQLKNLVEAKIGLTIRDLYTIGFAVAGAIDKNPCVVASSYSNAPGIAQGAEKAFFRLVAADLNELRQTTKENQIYDRRWAFSFNPLRAKPLIFDSQQPDLLMGISEKLLIWRITDGLYYDICKLKGFSVGWGAAFEKYIGDVLTAALSGSGFTVLSEQPYFPKPSERHDGADWIISDATGHVFIECKTKRLKIEAKMDFYDIALNEEIDTLANFFLQNYKNIQDARNQLLPDFEMNGLPVFCVVVTLENWRAQHPMIKDNLDALIRQKVAMANLPISIVDDCPYLLFNAQQFEKHMQDVARHNIQSTFLPKSEFCKGPYRHLFPGTLTALLPFLDSMPDSTQL
ncbi:hypothetical protein [Iodobacter fluviatilis]|nr:hypothetical protein [Iodobacter fluviatilis]